MRIWLTLKGLSAIRGKMPSLR